MLKGIPDIISPQLMKTLTYLHPPNQKNNNYNDCYFGKDRLIGLTWTIYYVEISKLDTYDNDS